MNDDRCVRDRVTAILTLADEARAQGTWADVDWDPEWAYRRLLEALDTIDKARALHFDNGDDDCVECGWAFPCGTVQELVINGGNESRDDR